MEKDQDFSIGPLETKDLEGLIPVLRHWVRDGDQVQEEEFQNIFSQLAHHAKDPGENIFLVARDPAGRAVAVMGCGEVNAKMVGYRSSPDRRAAGLLTAFISPDCRGKGLGERLLRNLFVRAAAAGWQEMIWSSHPRFRHTAWAFYTKLAGEPVGHIPGLFGEESVTPVWRKTLTS
ncbi:MAG: GNAT family N-acetyltransferase [Syntrophales bacterium]|nr:GNAT family N-acetyltransferase [Syntrophales bacterium]